IDFRAARIEHVGDLDRVLAESDVIVDCMGWTQHRAALDDPLYDLELNVASHLHWLRRVPDHLRAKVVYLGSRGQYADPATGDIGEDDPQEPRDVQGIHKAAAERHFRLAASLRDLDVVALRLPACVGPNQPAEGEDIGLVGGFARDLLAGRAIRVYGRGRRRAVAYVDDVAEIVCQLARLPGRGFQAYNLRGDVLAEQVARFEESFARYLGVGHAIGVGNATDGLTLALRAVGVEPGDEVVTTPFTAIPTVSAIVDAGATPVFVDVCPDTYLLDCEQVASAMSARTRAVVPVHLFGNVVDVARLRAVVGPTVPIVEDAAQAHGSTLAGRHAG